jgi:hypothetical protein
MKHPVYKVRYYQRFYVTAVGLGTYYPEYGGTTVLVFPVNAAEGHRRTLDMGKITQITPQAIRLDVLSLVL